MVSICDELEGKETENSPCVSKNARIRRSTPVIFTTPVSGTGLMLYRADRSQRFLSISSSLYSAASAHEPHCSVSRFQNVSGSAEAICKISLCIPDRLRDSELNPSSSCPATLDGLVSSVAAPDDERMVLAGDLGDLGVLIPTFNGAGNVMLGRLMFSQDDLGFQDVAALRTESGRMAGTSGGTTYESGGLPTVWRACNLRSGFLRFFLRRDEARLDGVSGDCSLREVAC